MISNACEGPWAGSKNIKITKNHEIRDQNREKLTFRKSCPIILFALLIILFAGPRARKIRFQAARGRWDAGDQLEKRFHKNRKIMIFD